MWELSLIIMVLIHSADGASSLRLRFHGFIWNQWECTGHFRIGRCCSMQINVVMHFSLWVIFWDSHCRQTLEGRVPYSYLPMWPSGWNIGSPCAVERDTLIGHCSHLSPDALPKYYSVHDEQGVNPEQKKKGSTKSTVSSINCDRCWRLE